MIIQRVHLDFGPAVVLSCLLTFCKQNNYLDISWFWVLSPVLGMCILAVVALANFCMGD